MLTNPRTDMGSVCRTPKRVHTAAEGQQIDERLSEEDPRKIGTYRSPDQLAGSDR